MSGYVTILPGLSPQPTRDELVGMFYNLLFTDLAPFLSRTPAALNMPLDDAEYPLIVRDLTEVEEDHIKRIYPGQSYIFVRYWGTQILIAGTSSLVTVALDTPRGQKTIQKVLD